MAAILYMSTSAVKALIGHDKAAQQPIPHAAVQLLLASYYPEWLLTWHTGYRNKSSRYQPGSQLG